MPNLTPRPSPSAGTTPGSTAGTRRLTPESTADDALVQRFNTGDEAAFVELMERHRGKVFTITLGLLRNRADAEEITQDTFIRAYRALANFRGDSSLATWLYRIAVNLARNRYWYFHRRRRQDAVSFDAALGVDGTSTLADLVAAPVPDPAQETVTAEFATLVDQCMQHLDARQREILTLRNVLHHPYEEIARVLGINVGTVKSRIARARENLRALLAASCPEFAPDADAGEWFLSAPSGYGRPMIACA